MLALNSVALYVQVYRNAPSSQVRDPQHAADHISTEIVEDKDFPYWISIFVHDRSTAFRVAIVAIILVWLMIEV